MPLAAGGDLRPREAAAFLAHVDACPACREELEAFRAAMAGIKAAAKAESVGEWSEGEWSALMARVRAEAGRDGASSATALRPAFGARWAAAAAAGAFLGLIVLGLLFRGPSPRPGRGPEEAAMVVAAAPGPQERVAITMVSTETGLQVVWFLDKNFNYEGERN
jgi:anti-sigma factor RsiW